MTAVELTEAFLAKVAGWEAMKQARSLLERGQVLSSDWSPPLLKGVVQEGSISYRAGLVVKGAIDLENLCSCRMSRQWGTICGHSVAVGLHHLARGKSSAANSIAEKSNSTSQDKKAGLGATPAATLQSATGKGGKKILRARDDTGGEPAELFVILPPNLAQALAKDRVMMCFEAKWKNGRGALNVLPDSIPFRFSARESALLDHLETLAEGETPGQLSLNGELLAGVLARLVEHPRVSLGKSQPVTITASPWRTPLRASLKPSGEILINLESAGEMPSVVRGETSWVFREQTFQPIGIPKAYHELFRGPLQLTRANVPQFLAQDWNLLEITCELKADFKLSDFVIDSEPPEFRLSLEGGLARLRAEICCAYGDRVFRLGTKDGQEHLWAPDPNSPKRYFAREISTERAALGRIVRCGFVGPDTQGRYELNGQNSVLNFLGREYPRLQKEWRVTLEERLDRSISQNIERIEPRFQITPSGERWFDLDLSYSTSSGEKFSAAEIHRLILSSQSHARLKNGRMAVIDTGALEEFQEVLLDCSPDQRQGSYRFQNRQMSFLESTIKDQPGWKIFGVSPGRASAARLESQVPPLGELENILRPYQKQGVAWMHFLRENLFGGILADEMGLGKTLQTLAYFQTAVANQKAENRKPALVVCPTSLIFNWVAEARHFTPRLRVIALHGPDRHESFSKIPMADLVVTSYALIRRDADLYRELEFDTVVLDEAQHIKNRQTQNAQAVKAIRSAHRLVLTGTPLENSVLDLWSIFDFLMPGYLGSAGDFRERYEIPITKNKSSVEQGRLARRVRPFILRRLKREVARELPEKIEQVIFCELTTEQQTVYRQVLDASRREVLNATDAQGAGKSRMIMLSALLRLRQICCDLRLLKLEKIDTQLASAKLDVFQELLEEIIDGGHRVLVFSQFVTMLALIRERLTAAEIEYSYLDGSTLDRAEVVARFQTKSSIPVFLISLKAGGLGLNLTGADTVIHFDPWWNPAVESQATDRAHRIGQTRVVTSYKLIARGTVEEKILNLQNRKRETLQSVFSDEEGLANAVTWEEMQELLT